LEWPPFPLSSNVVRPLEPDFRNNRHQEAYYPDKRNSPRSPLDPLGILLLTLPVLLPMSEAINADPAWLGVIVKDVEIRLLTPPVDLNV
jgi:hypothetical protein